MNNEPVAWFYAYPDDIEDKFLCGNPELIESMKSCGKDYIITPLYIHPVKELTDEEINNLWAESHEDGIAVQQGFTTQQHYFAHLILRKAQEK